MSIDALNRNRYTGTKSLYAWPMTKAEYCAYRGWDLPLGEDPAQAGYLVEYEDGGKANDSRHAGYISWSPADVFDRTYKPAAEVFVQPKITGYRQLSDAEVALMNEAKALAEQCGAYIAKLRGPIPDGQSPTGTAPQLDQRWISIGATQLQQGFMALTRAVAQPTTF